MELLKSELPDDSPMQPQLNIDKKRMMLDFQRDLEYLFDDVVVHASEAYDLSAKGFRSLRSKAIVWLKYQNPRGPENDGFARIP